MEDFTKTINPAMVPAYDLLGRPGLVRLWVKVEYKGGRLSITGVEGPKRNGDAHGNCGQCGVHPEATPTHGYTTADLERLRLVWDLWHLNDCRPYSAAMKAAGWHEEARRVAVGYEFTRTMEAQRAAEDAEKAALAAARAGVTFTPTPEQVTALCRPYSVTLWVMDGEPEPPAPDGMARAKHLYGHFAGNLKHPERKTLGWLYPSEHPAGLLGRKLHPDDAKGYGCQWWKEDVPEDVLAWLRNLPEPPAGVNPAWV